MVMAEEQMHILIAGGGLGGAACAIACARRGMKVTLFDQVKQFQPLGDSVGFGSNTTKLFKRWGMYDDLYAICCRATKVYAYNWNGQSIGIDPTPGQAEERFGHKPIIGHRGDYHMIFLEHCRKNGVEVRMDAKVVGYDVDKPSIFLESGEEVVGDAVIAADGVKSLGRQQVLGYFDKPVHSGYAVWRAYMDSAIFRDDPLTAKFVNEGDTMNVWVGPDVHGLVTTVCDGAQINAVLTHKDEADVAEGWSTKGEREDVLNCIKGWDPSLVRVWEKIENILDWKLVYRPCLEQWVTPSGLVAIMGDAAHPFLPTSSQGASQAVEDGAVIAMCLEKAGKDNVPLALKTYFELRYEHVDEAQGIGITQRDKWHNAHDKETGELMRDLKMEEGVLDSYYLWMHDCEHDCEEKWEDVSGKIRQQEAEMISSKDEQAHARL